MRRLGLIAVVSLCFIAVVGTSALARPSTTGFSVKVGKAQQGGTIELSVKGKSSVKRATFSATAVIHFASGDVTTELARSGKSYEARARVGVGANEAPGEVAVDVTIRFNDQIQVLSTKAVVEAKDDDHHRGRGDRDH
jgi:hypothetical protein